MPGPVARWLADLRRRKVFRVGAVYAAVALALIEASDLVLSPLGVPAWVHTVIVALAAAGFPLALVLAWALEVTPEGVRRTEDAYGEGPAGAGGARTALLEAALLVAIVGAGIWLVAASGDGPDQADRGGSEVDRASIAVLPFANLSADPENAYFADGLAEEILNELAHLETLRVAARTSSFAFRDSAVDVPRIADALRVATVLEGSVRRSADRVLVTAQLIDADGFHLWSEEYERPLSDVFRIQDEIAREIARALGGRLLASEAARLEGSGTTDVQAHDSYLKGLHALGQRSGASIRAALGHFQRAVDLDPSYAEAYAGLAQGYYLLPLFTEGTAGETMAVRAKEAATEAIRLDPTSAEAYAVLGGVAYQIELEMELAEEELLRAIELSPSYATAHQWLAETFATLGRFEEARAHIETAIELDPVSPVVRLIEGFILWYGGRWRDGDAIFREVLRMDDSFAFALFYYPDLLIRLGEYDRAREVADRAGPLYYADDPEAAGTWRRGVELLAAALESAGRRDEAVAHWRSAPDRGVDLHWSAKALAYLGDVEGSVAVLRDMRSRRDPSFVWAPAVFRWFPELQADEEYRALIRDAGLPLLDAEGSHEGTGDVE